MISTSVFYVCRLRAFAGETYREGDENNWGFGQGISVIILVLPLTLIIETCYGLSSWKYCPCLYSILTLTDAYKDSHRRSERFCPPQPQLQPSTSTSLSSQTQDDSTATHAIVWDSEMDPDVTSWVSAVEITSQTTVFPSSPSQAASRPASCLKTSQFFSPGTSTTLYSRVQLDQATSKAKSAAVGYYDGHEKPVGG